MKIHYAVVGLNHRTAPVAVREQLALNGARLEEALDACRVTGAFTESVVLSTCNRVEFYVAGTSIARVHKEIARLLRKVCRVKGKELDIKQHLYHMHDRDALRHLFRVASSLDSMVVGESQILGQLKQAYQKAVSASNVGTYLNRAMHRAFNVAKRVRTETRISEGGISVSFVASQLAAKIFGDLERTSVLLVGAGEMAELAAKNLASHGARRIAIANRSRDRAEALAAKLSGVAHPLEALPELLLKSDIVISSTGASRPILHRSTLASIARARKYKPLFIIDIAVPRDVEPAASDLDGVYLYDVDDLQQVAAANMAARQREARSAERLIDEELEHFMTWLDQADVVPTVVALRRHHAAIQAAEVERALGKLSHLSKRDQQAVRALAHALTNKFLHAPTVGLKRIAAEGRANREVVDMVHDLFDLPDPQLEPQPAAQPEAEPRKALTPGTLPAKA